MKGCTLLTKGRERRTDPARSGKGGGHEDTQNNHPELNAWVKSTQASPNLRKASATSQVADHLRRRRFLCCLQVEEAARRGGSAPLPFTPLEEVTAALDGCQRRRIKIQDLTRHTMLICGADALLGRGPRGNLARELSKAIPSERGAGTRVQMDPVGQNGDTKFRTLTQRLLKR